MAGNAVFIHVPMRAQGHGHYHINDLLQEKGTGGGSARRFTEKGARRAIVSQTNTSDGFQGNIGEISGEKKKKTRWIADGLPRWPSALITF